MGERAEKRVETQFRRFVSDYMGEHIFPEREEELDTFAQELCRRLTAYVEAACVADRMKPEWVASYYTIFSRDVMRITVHVEHGKLSFSLSFSARREFR